MSQWYKSASRQTALAALKDHLVNQNVFEEGTAIPGMRYTCETCLAAGNQATEKRNQPSTDRQTDQSSGFTYATLSQT